MSKRLSILFLLLISLFSALQKETKQNAIQLTQIKWNRPVLLKEETHQFYAYPTSVYYDPVSGINHVLYADDYVNYYWHAAVSDEGKILYSTLFQCRIWAITGLIRGPKDGEHLYLSLAINDNGIYKINFTESNDNGKTWSPHKQINDNQSHSITLQDMIYIKETGRIFIFYLENGSESMHVITRPPGSTAFSAPIRIVSCNGHFEFELARAAYSVKDGRSLLHLFYHFDKAVYYTKSLNNGLTWTDPFKVSGNNEVSVICRAITDMTGRTNFVSVSYIIWSTGDPAKFVYSRDSGDTFSDEFNLTQHKVKYYQAVHAMQIFGTLQNPMMATFFSTQDKNAEFAIWNYTNVMQKEKIEHPFSNNYDDDEIRSQGLDFIMINDFEFKASAFISKISNGQFQLWFSHGIGTISNQKY